jgi:hypothetical protein
MEGTVIFNTIRVFEYNLFRQGSLTHVQFFSSILTNQFIKEVGSYQYPSAAIIVTRNSCCAIAK